MSRNGSGTYTFPSNSFNPAVDNTVIDASDWNDVVADVETAMSASIAADGQTTTTATIPFAAGLTTRDVLATSNDSGAIGASGTAFSDLFLASGAVINFAAGNFSMTHSTGALALSGLVDISGASAGQIKFPATQNSSSNANTIDDYEEGTFTPAIAFGGGTTGITYSVQVGAYTKIGNLVSFTIRIDLSSEGTDNGDLTITGLPFTSLDATNRRWSFASSWSGLSGVAGHIQCSLANNATTITVSFLGTGTPTAIDRTHTSDTTTLYISGQYQTA